MEAVLIIKEMRKATHGLYPRFALWENVPGAFSSNRGEDFRTVLEELIRIPLPGAVMPPVPRGGWAYADSYTGDGWSLAYRVFDAQYWGVPQRRRRIHLVLDLGGECAREVLFEREGLRGYFAPSGAQGEGTAPDAEGSPGADDRPGAGAGGLLIPSHPGCTDGLLGGLDAVNCLTPWDCQSKRIFSPDGCYPTLQAMSGGGANNTAVLLPEPLAFTQNQRDEVRDLGDKAGSLAAQPGMKQQTFIIDSIGGQSERGWESSVAPTLKATHYKSAPCVTVPAAGFCTEHSANSRGVGFQEEEVSPTLRAGVTPACIIGQHLFENHSQDTRYRGPLEVAQTVSATYGMGGNNQPFVVEGQPVYCLQGNGIDRADTAGCNGLGVREGDKMYTLTAKDAGAHSVCYGIGNGQANQSFSEELVGALNCMHDQQAVAYGVDPRNLTESPELFQTLQAKPNGGQSLNYSGAVRVRYIVRRLTPIECARLQGFADCWGHIEKKESFTDAEWCFWSGVRNTHAAINGRAVKSYTKAQMLSWYNKLHTDSAEYKMWGNGIALPPALYCMQGITDVLLRGEDDSWML